ncbi:TIGR02285 family protein [Massilia sp. Root351]|jgi:uncharacterized protein (TIGR02285 family)|uniref:TIGR02285 family protein n=1 Tax=Massilia sp. Root351 TaxID=1736522 RepID=UPI0009EB97E7|nr:TIGR02285 family protein [Massilia sp. Root351]
MPASAPQASASLPLHRRALSVALAVAALLSACRAAQAGDVMTWVMPDFAPASIPVNGKPGQGVADQAVNFILARWPHTEHRFIYANARRTWEMLGRGEQVCFAAALRTPDRERIAYFSDANRLPPPSLVVRSDTLPAIPLNSAGEANLTALLAQGALRGLVVDKRSYGEFADQAIAQRPAPSGLHTTAAGNYGKNIFKMIAAGRTDYTLDYDFAFAYERARAPELATLATVPVAGSGAPVTAGFACPRTPWGRAAIIRIDRLLGTREGAAALVRAQSSWQTESSRQRYAADTAEFARRRARPSPASDFD